VYAWWRRLPSAERPQRLAQRDDLPAAIAWHTPYYRVRIGPFLRREQAQAVLSIVAPAFPNAMIAREQVPPR
jgi:hypothetical protein